MFSGGVRTLNTGFRNSFIFVPAAGATLRIDLRIETSGRGIKTPQPKKIVPPMWLNVLSVNFLSSQSWIIYIRRCRKSGYHHGEDLAKYDYNPNMKRKDLVILLYVWLHTEIQIWVSGNLYYLLLNSGHFFSFQSFLFKNLVS